MTTRLRYATNIILNDYNALLDCLHASVVMPELDIRHLVKSSENNLKKLRWGHLLLNVARESRIELEVLNGGPNFRGCMSGLKKTDKNQVMQALFSPAIRKVAKRMRQGRQKFIEERLNRHDRDHHQPDEQHVSLKASASALAFGVACALRTQEPRESKPETGRHKTFEAKDETSLVTAKRLVTATIPQNGPQTQLLNHSKGSAVYYGSVIALQAHHGGYLGLGHRGRVEARATWPTPPCHFTLWNMMDLGYIGAVRYGDRVWLQCSRYELLGTSAMSRDVGCEWTAMVNKMAEASRTHKGDERPMGPDWRQFSSSYATERQTARLAAETLAEGPITQPVGGRIRETVGRLVAVPCGSASAVGARASGRWVILHRREPHTTIGTNVVHEDEIVLQQEELYMSSRKKDSCELRVPRTDVTGLTKFGQAVGDAGLAGRPGIPEDEVCATGQAIKTEEGINPGFVFGLSDVTQPVVNIPADVFDKEFCFTLLIMKLPTSSLDERKRMESAMRATIQLAKSKDQAVQRVPDLMRVRHDQRLEAKAHGKDLLQRTLNERAALEARMIRQYRECSLAGWKQSCDVPSYSRPTSLPITPPPKAASEINDILHREFGQNVATVAARRAHADKHKKIVDLAQLYDQRVSQSTNILGAFKAGSQGRAKLLRRTKAIRILQNWCRSKFACKWARRMSKLDWTCICEIDAERRKGNSHGRGLTSPSPTLRDFVVADGTPNTIGLQHTGPGPTFSVSSAQKLRDTVNFALALSGEPHSPFRTPQSSP